MAIQLGNDNSERKQQLKKAGIIVGGCFVLAIAAGWFFSGVKPDFTNVCEQGKVIIPKGQFEDSSIFSDPRYVDYSAKVLGGAVQIPTETYDDMDLDVSQEPRFKIFKKLHTYLEEQFPLAFQFRETVNEYGLLYTIEGTNKSLKPIVLMAHQDVVPVNPSTVDQWDYKPFSGHFDGEWIYGRGSADTKNSLIAQLEAVEYLLQQRWQPERTVILSYGFDEEIEGHRGAQHIAKELVSRYGKHGVEAIVDEGFGLQTFHGTTFAMPAVAEKGRVDFNIELLTKGGHSSMPPDHTGIGMLAQLVNVLEENPLTPDIAEGSILTETFGCIGRWAGDELPYKERVVLGGLKHAKMRQTLAKALQADPKQKWLVRTSQAVDLFNGGVKVNALPEKTVVQVDHRIAIHQTIGDLKDRLAGYAKDLAEKFDLSVEFDGKTHRTGATGVLNITSFGGINPAPVSSTHNKAWEILTGTTKNIFENVFNSSDISDNVYMSPIVMTANTDTAHYWDVSKAIYRYNPVLIEDMVDFHTVNEKLRFRSHLYAVAWFYEYLINYTSE